MKTEERQEFEFLRTYTRTREIMRHWRAKRRLIFGGRLTRQASISGLFFLHTVLTETPFVPIMLVMEVTNELDSEIERGARTLADGER
jgi:hypothetical protein